MSLPLNYDSSDLRWMVWWQWRWWWRWRWAVRLTLMGCWNCSTKLQFLWFMWLCGTPIIMSWFTNNLSIHEWYAYHCASVYHNHTFLTIGEIFNTVFPVCMLECAHACVYECMSTLRAYVALADCYHSINFASYVTVTFSMFI